MKVAHLILAHKNPKQLERLIVALDHPEFAFFVHVDKKTAIQPFLYLANKQNVFFIKDRTKVYWAAYGTIQATLNGFKEILSFQYDYINVISAQDFPLKPATSIYKFLLAQKGNEFITCESIKDEWKEAAPRVLNYHFINWHIPGKFRLATLANHILPARNFPLDYEIVGRANWFTITTNAAQYILNTIKAYPSLVNYFKYCWGADEFFFATILYNSPFKERIKRNLVYVDWTTSRDGHPKILGVEDFDKLIASDMLFARKFDYNKDEAIIDLLQQHIEQLSSSSSIILKS